MPRLLSSAIQLTGGLEATPPREDRGLEYLVRLAQEDPKTFVSLLMRTMPPEPKEPQQAALNINIDLT